MMAMNDATNYYVLFDMIGDTSNDPSGNDFFWLAFDVNLDKLITPNVDVMFQTLTYSTLGKQTFLGPQTWTPPSSPVNSSVAGGFGRSMNSSTPHRFWEVKISRADIGATTSDQLRMGVRTRSSAAPSFDDFVPSNFINDFTNLIQDALSGPATTWSGDVSISFQLTSESQDASGNTKFTKSNSTFSGSLEIYISNMGPQPNAEGCYARFSDNGGSKICIDQIVELSTEAQKSKTDQLIFTGTGTMTMMFGGSLSLGIAYLDSKGTFKKDTSGEITSISLSGKIGGGTNGIFGATGSVKTTLTK